MSMISSLTAPVNASLSPTSLSSNLGHSTPGISKSSKPSSSFTHCLPLVTPGLSSTFASLDPASLFINDDLPTFGIPTIIILIGLPDIPLAFHFSISSFKSSLSFP